MEMTIELTMSQEQEQPCLPVSILTLPTLLSIIQFSSTAQSTTRLLTTRPKSTALSMDHLSTDLSTTFAQQTTQQKSIQRAKTESSTVHLSKTQPSMEPT